MNYSTRSGSPYTGKTFQVRDIRQWASHIRDRKGEESRLVAFKVIFVIFFWSKIVLACIFM